MPEMKWRGEALGFVGVRRCADPTLSEWAGYRGWKITGDSDRRRYENTGALQCTALLGSGGRLLF